MRKIIAATTLAASLTLLPALDTIAHAQDDAAATEDDGDSNTGLWGLAGLLGLVGLAGLKRRDTHSERPGTTTSTGVPL